MICIFFDVQLNWPDVLQCSLICIVSSLRVYLICTSTSSKLILEASRTSDALCWLQFKCSFVCITIVFHLYLYFDLNISDVTWSRCLLDALCHFNLEALESKTWRPVPSLWSHIHSLPWWSRCLNHSYYYLTRRL
jgi:hypothetical protein